MELELTCVKNTIHIVSCQSRGLHVDTLFKFWYKLLYSLRAYNPWLINTHNTVFGEKKDTCFIFSKRMKVA